MRWTDHPCDERKAAALERDLGLSRGTARFLVTLGHDDADRAHTFLNPLLRSIDDPFRITNMDRAVKRLRMAMARAEKILVFGDYDVDGVTSTALLVRIIQMFGLAPRYVVPRRLEEGYGLSINALERAIEKGKPDLLVAVDCGTNSREEVAWLRRNDIDVIIIDHHASKMGVPDDCVIVNPHLFDDPAEPWADLCSVGLVFKFVHALLKELRREGDDVANQIDLKEFLDFASLGTVADLVPLRGENRILAKSGLASLQLSQRPGISALFTVSGMRMGDPVTPFDISFRLGPRINASGRLAEATIPIDLLLSDNFQECLNAARMLDDFNRERQEIEREIVKAADQMIEESQLDSPGIVLYQPDWHPGVVGIVASRISRKYHRPCLVMGEEGGFAKGSGRSIEGINLVEVLTPCADLLEHWGGHPMAVGVAARPSNLSALRLAFNESILRAVLGALPEPELQITAWVSPHDLTTDLLGELELLSPFGQGNPEPVFGLRDVRIMNSPTPFGNGHFRFQLECAPGIPISGVAWKPETPMPTRTSIDLAVRFGWNCWNGRKCPRLTLVDWRFAS